MSEEVKQVEEQVSAPEQNIENKTSEASPQKEQHMVPYGAMKEERTKRQQLEAEVAKLKQKAEVTDQMLQLDPKLSLDTLRQRIASYRQPQTPQHVPQPTYTPTTSNSENERLAKLEAMLLDDKRERELEKFEKSGVLEMNEDMRDDILSYSKDKGLSIKEAAFARYGESIIQKRAKTEEKHAKEEAADMSLVTGSSESGSYIPHERVELTAQELQWAKMAGMTPEQWALYSSNNEEAIRKYHTKK